ncbi:DNA sulfur modification protein DndD [Dyella sp. A6]|uniref:DNA sulfur modification protein DndD n=1 Tax=Dyella aluminiiresistens TaxID=3069105 RepID=UPI002E7924F4|nr:DNA sulfur modification protein DndD [Dyella sp. A6]
MLIHSLTLENFGLYAGRQTIAVSTDGGKGKPRPVVLIGGRNGSGKTSFLEAVRIALYGKLALGDRTSQAAYEAHLRSRIHVGSAAPASEAGVELDFDFAEDGMIHRYKVVRRWAAKGERIQEDLQVFKNGDALIDAPREEWPHFLEDLLPAGISQLFFFDGEKITEMADDAREGQQLSAAIRTLLGIELVGRLRTDLGIYLAKMQRADANQSGELDAILAEIERLRVELSEHNDRRADLMTSLDSHRRAVQRTQQRFTASGGDVALNHGRLTGERQALVNERNTLLAQFREGSSRMWPWLVAPKLLVQLTEAVHAGDGHEHAEAGQKLLAAFDRWQKRSTTTVQRRWTARHREELEALVAKSLGIADAKSGARHFKDVPNASDILAQATASSAPAAAFSERLREIDERIAGIDVALTRVDEATSNHLLEELRNAEATYGVSLGRVNQIDESIKMLQFKMANAQRERERFLTRQAEDTKGMRQAALARQVAGSLAQYESALLLQKTRALEVAFVDCFNRLARKSELVRSVRINDRTFETTLIDGHGAEIARAALSAGEKQIFAIAMLWALAKTSGRSLPVIIDTPLARLDTEHRTAILERYFTEVSHQVIVLSTDTEIDGEAAQDLQPHVAASIKLEYLPGERRTQVTTGYFAAPNRTGATNAVQ